MRSVNGNGFNIRNVMLKISGDFQIIIHLYFAGEIVNVDAITGGFNFQNAWTSGFIVAASIG